MASTYCMIGNMIYSVVYPYYECIHLTTSAIRRDCAGMLLNYRAPIVSSNTKQQPLTLDTHPCYLSLIMIST
eukprot:6317329-Ditylum_brightwellii.AAC.1